MVGSVLVWVGVVLTAAGLLAIIGCIIAVRHAKRQGDAVLQERMRILVPANMAALFVSTLGLMAVIVGLVLR